LLSLTDVSGSPTTAKLDGGTPADEKPANASQQLVVRKRLRNRKSSQQNQLSSHDLLTDPFAARLTENLGLGFGTLRSNDGIALLLERAEPKPITR
jgi:hypothetical protein